MFFMMQIQVSNLLNEFFLYYGISSARDAWSVPSTGPISRRRTIGLPSHGRDPGSPRSCVVAFGLLGVSYT